MVDIYIKYHNSNDWKRVVDAVKNRDGNRCKKCQNANKKFIAHHISYENWGKGNDHEIDDCELLCTKCHAEEHRGSKISVPFFAQRKFNSDTDSISKASMAKIYENCL